MRLLVATRNKDKLKEYQKILKPLFFTLISLDQVKTIPKTFLPQEKGRSLTQNAIIKATNYGKLANMLTLADDTGLFIDHLNGFPGIYSARFAKNNYNTANQKILDQLKDVARKKRTAQFKISLALFNPQTNLCQVFSAAAKGLITLKPLGKHGFGYDAIFWASELKKTYAQASNYQKNQHSHRAKALKKLNQYLSVHHIKS